MKVGAGGVAALADRSDDRAPFDLLALFYLDPLEVGVAGLVPAIMFDNNEAAEISRTAGEADPTVGSCTNLGSLGRGQVEALVT